MVDEAREASRFRYCKASAYVEYRLDLHTTFLRTLLFCRVTLLVTWSNWKIQEKSKIAIDLCQLITNVSLGPVWSHDSDNS